MADDQHLRGMSDSAPLYALLILLCLPIVRYVPDWFPGTGWKVKAKLFKKLVDEMADVPFQFVKDQMVS